MGQADRTIIVHAYDDKNEEDGIGFNMSGFGVRNEEIKSHKDKAKPVMKKKDPHKVTFELANRSSVDLRFPKNASDAIWVSGNDRDCPRSPAQNNEIRPQSVSKDGERLTVHNLNSKVGRYKFSLNFIDADNPQKVYLYDPIWDNSNGGQ